jgi:hypothetical protein
MEPIAAVVSTEGLILSMAKKGNPRDGDAARASTDSLGVRKAAMPLFACFYRLTLNKCATDGAQ